MSDLHCHRKLLHLWLQLGYSGLLSQGLLGDSALG